MTLQIDSEFKSLIPSLSTEEYAQLESNILADGCRDAIVTWQGVIVDGHNRYEICSKHGLAYATTEHEFNGRDNAIEWIIRNQFGRRNLPLIDRIRLAKRLAPIIEERARENQLAALKQGSQPSVSANWQKREEPIHVAKEVAKLAGTSERTIHRYDAVERSAPEPIKESVRRGEISIHDAYQRTREIEKQQQRVEKEAFISEAVDRLNQANESNEPQTVVSSGDVWRLGKHTLYCGDTASDEFKGLCSPAAFAFADPPYNAGVAEWDRGFIWSHDYLKEFASVVAVTPGIASIQYFMQRTEMPYQWSMSAWIDNGMTRGALGFGNWIFVALFGEESLYRNAQDFMKISISSSDRDELEHKGRKPLPLLIKLIELFTKPDELVIDPFLGSGTTLIACQETGRVCIGGEINPTYCTSIVTRWQALTGLQAERVQIAHPV